ncbi:MAG: hypothetical protein ACTSU5_08860 [Promethearchaeota archaeon]
MYPTLTTFEYTRAPAHYVQFGTEFFMDPSLSDEDLLAQLDFLKDNNVTYLKLKDFRWNVLQPGPDDWNPDHWNWTRYDFVVDACVQRGFRLMGMTACLTGYSIDYITSIPDWVDYWVFDDAEIAKYANFTEVLVKHYEDRIREWQIGNEVDLVWLLHHKRGGSGFATNEEGLNATEWALWPSEENIVRWYAAVSSAVKEVDEAIEVHVNLVVGCDGWEDFLKRVVLETQVNGVGVDIYPGTIHMGYAEEYYVELQHFQRWTRSAASELNTSRPVELVLAEFGYAADSSRFPTTEAREESTLRDHFAVVQRCPVQRAFFHQVFDKPPVVYNHSLPGYEQRIGVVSRDLVPSPAFETILPAFSGSILPLSSTAWAGTLARLVLSFFAFMGTPANYHPWMSPFPAFLCFLAARVVLGVYLGWVFKKNVAGHTQVAMLGTWGVVQFVVLPVGFGAWPIKPGEMVPAYFGSAYLTVLVVVFTQGVTRFTRARWEERRAPRGVEGGIPGRMTTCPNCGKPIPSGGVECPKCKFNPRWQLSLGPVERGFYPALVLLVAVVLSSAYVNVYGYVYWMFGANEYPWWFRDRLIQGAVLFSWLGLWWAMTQVSAKHGVLKKWPRRERATYLGLALTNVAVCLFPIFWVFLFPKVNLLTWAALVGVTASLALSKLTLRRFRRG